jgi:hypothetical protein
MFLKFSIADTTSCLPCIPEPILSHDIDIQKHGMIGSRLEGYHRIKRLFAPGGPIVEGDPDEISALGGIMSNTIT